MTTPNQCPSCHHYNYEGKRIFPVDDPNFASLSWECAGCSHAW